MADAEAAPGGAATGGRLLERGRELGWLDAAVRDVVAGRAGVVLVEGPAGVGKTRLLAEARVLARRASVSPLSASGAELERDFSFGVVRQLFEPQLADPAVRAQALTGAASAAEGIFGSVSDDAQYDPSFAALHGLYWLVVNLAGSGPLMLLVDDVQWCDRPSLRFLVYLVRRIEGLPVLVVCGHRSAEPGVDPALLGELAADPARVLLRPAPLSESAVTDVIAERLRAPVDKTFAATCHAATGGNPLLLTELTKALDAEGVPPQARHVDLIAAIRPRAVSRSVLVRLARLPEEAARVARAVAVLGHGAPLPQVAALAGLDPERAEAGADALLRAEIVCADPGLSFVHPLVGAAVYEDMTTVQRARLHQQAARLLVDAGAPVEQVAAHLMLVPPDGQAWVVELLRTAARDSLRAGAADSAVAYLGRALTEPPDGEQRTQVVLELGRAEVLTNGPHASAHLRQGYDATQDPVTRAGVAQLLARTLVLTGHADEGAAVARKAIADLPSGQDDLRIALESFEAMTVIFSGNDTQSLARLQSLRTAPIRPGLAGKMLATMVAREWTFAGGPSQACAALALQALAGGELMAADDGFLAIVAITTLARADREEAMTAWQAALDEAHRHGSLLAKCGISWGLGFTHARRGQLDEAERWLRTALDEFEMWGLGPRPGPIDCVAQLTPVLIERGQLDAARRELDRFHDPGDSSDSARFWLNAKVELLLAEQDFQQALAVADDLARRLAYLRHPIDTPWHAHRALALAGLGRHEEAIAAAEQDLALAQQWGAPNALGRALRVLGTLHDDLDRLHEAVAVTSDRPARLEHAKALAALGHAMRLAGHPGAARDPLRDALQIAEQCAAGRLVQQARAELYATGARPTTRTISGPQSLTPSERRVAELAAGGASNREIAQMLFVTPKTVELHLSNSFRKLDIRSRRELPAALDTKP